MALTGLEGAQSGPATRETESKKGVGLAERKGKTLRQLELLNVGWYYNWGTRTELTTRARFVPMVFSTRSKFLPEPREEYVLGYNEPDHPKQANMPVEDALSGWPRVLEKGRTAVSPALAGNPVTKEWLNAFLKGGARVDAIAVHWYKGADAAAFIRDLQQIHGHFRKPIWVTEFAPQTAAESRDNPGAYTQAQVNAFIRQTADFMESTPWVHRYAWHDSGAGTSALFDAKGELTPTGEAYARLRK
ncbi:MAG: glycosyl hydrolase [Opitutia bacterium]